MNRSAPPNRVFKIGSSSNSLITSLRLARKLLRHARNVSA
jgi:hypothetical protein